MITVPAGVRVYLALRATDMRKGFDGLSVRAQEVLREDPFSGHLFVFRGKRGDLIKVLGRSGSLPVRQAAGARKVHLAAGARGRGDAEPGAAVDVARGDRLEGTPAHRSSDVCRLMIQYVVPSRYAMNEVCRSRVPSFPTIPRRCGR